MVLPSELDVKGLVGKERGGGGGGGKMPLLPRSLWLLTIFSAIGGGLFGYGTGVVSGAMILIREDMELTTQWHELIVSVTIAAAWFSSLVAGPATDKFGRRPIILCASVIFFVGSLLLGLAWEKITLLLGRIVVGLAIGLVSMSVPVYLSESSTTEQRGCITIINNLFITGGQLLSGIVCGIFSTVPQGWRYMLGLGAFPCLIQLLGLSVMPESPRWLVAKGRLQEARRVLTKIRAVDSDLEGELEIIRAAVTESKDQKAHLGEVLRSVPARRALFLGSLLQLFQQITGINIVMYYSASIIAMAGLRNDSLVIWLAAAISSVNFLGTFIGLWLVDRMGRRFLTLTSLMGSMLALLLLALSFQVADIYSPRVDSSTNSTLCQADTCGTCNGQSGCGFCFTGDANGIFNSTCLPVSPDSHNRISLEGLCSNSTLMEETGATFAYNWCPFKYYFIPVLGLCFYLLFFAPGMGVMPWTINSEIFPGWARATCNSFTTSVNWGSNLVVSLTFLTLTEALGKNGAFYLYMCLAGVGAVVFYFFLPETRGVPLEEVEELFSGPLGAKPSRTSFKYKPANSSSQE